MKCRNKDVKKKGPFHKMIACEDDSQGQSSGKKPKHKKRLGHS